MFCKSETYIALNMNQRHSLKRGGWWLENRVFERRVARKQGYKLTSFISWCVGTTELSVIRTMGNIRLSIYQHPSRSSDSQNKGFWLSSSTTGYCLSTIQEPQFMKQFNQHRALLALQVVSEPKRAKVSLVNNYRAQAAKIQVLGVFNIVKFL